MNSNTYSMHRTGGELDCVLSNVESILALRKLQPEKRPKFHLRMINLGQPEHEYTALTDHFSNMLLPGDEISRKPLESFGGSVTELKEIKKDSCPFLFSGLAIYADGGVTTCCYDVNGKNKQGDLINQTLEEIFFSVAYQALRSSYLSGTLQAQSDSALPHVFIAKIYAFDELVFIDQSQLIGQIF